MTRYYIYLAHIPNTTIYKIGMTSNPKERIRSLKFDAYNRFGVKDIEFAQLLECHSDFAFYVEQKLHKSYKKMRVSGKEWYSLISIYEFAFVSDFNNIYTAAKKRYPMVMGFENFLEVTFKHFKDRGPANRELILDED